MKDNNNIERSEHVKQAEESKADAVGSTEQIVKLSEDQVAKPSTDQVAKPSTDQVAKPSTDQVAKPSTDQVAKPSTDQVAKPSEDQVAKPSEDQVANPSADQVVKPNADQAANPVAKQAVEPIPQPPAAKKEKIPLAGSKWSKWRLVHDVEALSECQPLTCPYTQKYLQRFLDRFETVFLKPDEGYGGTDVIRVRRDGETLQALRESESHTFASVDAFDAWLREIRGERTFLVQQGIDLMPYKGRLVDLRTILQKTPSGRWRVTGAFAKAAKQGMAVTNVKAGGHPFRVDKYLRRVVPVREERKRIERELVTLSVAVANVFEQHYSNTLYGLDIGLDRAGKLWLIEVNTRPSILILRGIDINMFRRCARLRWPQKYRR